MLFWAIPATVLIIVLRAQLVRTILGSGVFDWEATRLTAAALALFVVSLCAQSVTLLIARGYYAAGKSARPLFFALVSVFVTISTSALLVTLFHSSALWRNFLESLLRVADIPGTTVLMLALGYCVGALLQAVLGIYFFSKDFSFSLKGLRQLSFESFGSSLIGGVGAYTVLAYVGNHIDINTVLGVVSQGVLGGMAGLLVTVGMLALMQNRELIETYESLRKRFLKEPPVLEATDVA